jgi:hypothetical protein
LQIASGGQQLIPVSSDSNNHFANYIPANADRGANKLRAFLNAGFLLNRDTGVDIKVVSVDFASYTAQFQWKLDTQKTFNAEETLNVNSNFYNSRQNAYHVRPDTNNDGTVEDSGLYIYFDVQTSDFADDTTGSIFAGDRYYLNVTHNEGVRLSVGDGNTVHSVAECSGRGACSSGVCLCTPGFTGDACQRTTCPNDCSGHGTCQSLRYFVEEGTDAMRSYDAYDADLQQGCKCDAGFRGIDCAEIECPSGADPLGGEGGLEGRDCSGRGVCDYSSGICSCFHGFFGERCEEQTTFR